MDWRGGYVMTFSNRNRNQISQTLAKQTFDLLVIGGGIVGAGIALDASSRGMKTALVEMQDFSAGASSRSTKLVHGGFRYLEQKEFKHVAEVGKEREIIHHISPHITKPIMILQPYYKNGPRQGISTKVKLSLYDSLTGVKKKQRHQMLNKKAIMELEPLLQVKKLRGAGYYQEFQTDDARLTIEVLKRACQLGTKALNYLKVISLLYDDTGVVNGAEVEDQITGDCYPIYANKIVNATGSWINTLHSEDEKQALLSYTKGIHLVFHRDDFPIQQSVYFTNPEDNRMIFVLTRDNKVYVGTTDTPYQGDLTNPKVTLTDKKYLLAAISSVFPNLDLTESKIESSWAGIRSFITEAEKSTSEFTRKEHIFHEESGLVSITGGKLTGYRKVAERIVDYIAKQFKQERNILYSKSETKSIPLSGGDVGGISGFEQFKQQQIAYASDLPLDDRTIQQYIDRYGSNVNKIWEYVRTGQIEAKHYQIDLPIYAELCYALDYECIYKPLDFFLRRTGVILFNRDLVKRNLAGVLSFLSEKLHWDMEESAYYERECRMFE